MFELYVFRVLIITFMQMCCYLPINCYKLPTLTPMVPSHSTLSALIFVVGIMPITVSTKQREKKCARKIVHHGFNKTAFKR